MLFDLNTKIKKIAGYFTSKDLRQSFNILSKKLDREYVMYICISIVLLCSIIFSISMGIRNQRNLEKEVSYKNNELVAEEEVDNGQEKKLIELSHEVIDIQPTTEKIGQPIVYKNMIAWGGGNGSLQERFMKSLVLYDIKAKQEQLITEAKVKFGEINELAVNEKWIAWTDTDNNGSCVIKGMNIENAFGVFEIAILGYDPPGLEIDGDNLVWVDRSDRGNHKLVHFNMESGDIRIITQLEPQYGNSIPVVKNSIVIWADRDETGGENDSIIRIFDIESESEDFIKVGDFVHDPVTNGKAILWINGNHSPDSWLILSPNGTEEYLKIEQGVTTYGLGNNFVVYGKDDLIFIYFWETNEYSMILEKDEKGRNINVHRNRIAWLDYSREDNNVDMIKTTVIEHPNKSND